MHYDIRGSIKKLKKLALLKEYSPIRDRIYAVIYDKKKSLGVKLLIVFTIAKAG